MFRPYRLGVLEEVVEPSCNVAGRIGVLGVGSVEILVDALVGNSDERSAPYSVRD